MGLGQGIAMSSNKRKAPDEHEEAAASDEVVHPRFPESDHAAVQDNYYANLYKKEIDFRGLSKQDAQFAAMYAPLGCERLSRVRSTTDREGQAERQSSA
jgi:hypothetical protein